MTDPIFPTFGSSVFAVPPSPGGLPTELPAGLTRRVTEAAYLDTERTPCYRVIMRYFLQQAEAQVTWVKADDVLAHVRHVYDPVYDEVQRDRDLKFLSEKRNLLEVQDTRGARTAREFRNRKLEYHIRSDALRLERFVRELEQRPSEGGSLDPSLLERLWDRMGRLHGFLLEADRAAREVNPLRAEALWPVWEDAHAYVETLNTNTTAFHQALAEARPTDITDLAAFDYYKRVLFSSLAGFIVQLADVADRIQTRLAEWRAEGYLPVLVEHLIYHRTYKLVGANETDPVAVRAWAEQQVHFVNAWFRPDGTCDGVRRATRGAIATIGRHLERLAEREIGGHSRAHELRDLAVAFARVPDLATAHHLAVATFGAYWHRHFRGDADSASFQAGKSVWAQLPYVYPIKKIRQGRHYTDREASGLEDVSEKQQELMERQAVRRAEEAALWDTVFADGIVDLGLMRELSPVLRDRLLVVLRECLGSADAAALVLDGSRITLADPLTHTVGAITARDGTLWTPRFRLTRTDAPPEDGGEPQHMAPGTATDALEERSISVAAVRGAAPEADGVGE